MADQNSYIDEGYIKFNCRKLDETIPTHDKLDQLIHWRREMYLKNWIGFDELYQVGFGNISISDDQGFIISGTQTGHLDQLEPMHFTSIVNYDVSANSVDCIGPLNASSETMTHAVIYENDPIEINAVIHIHNKSIWEKLMWRIPTTREDVPYGTPEMAQEIHRLFKEEQLAEKKILAMAGHEDGIITFGKTLKEAAHVLYQFEKAKF